MVHIIDSVIQSAREDKIFFIVSIVLDILDKSFGYCRTKHIQIIFLFLFNFIH